MHDEQTARVIEAFLDGTLSPAQMDELAGIVARDSSVATELSDQAAIHTLVLALRRGVPAPPPWSQVAEKIWPGTRLAVPAVRRSKIWYWIPAAAAVFAGILGLYLLFNGYPEALVSTPGGGSEVIKRGAIVTTADTAKSLDLGGYCHVQIAPQSAVKLEGAKKAESLFLEKGGVVCEVDRNVGRFTVRSEIGAVTVTGTKFAAILTNADATADALMLEVSVASGTVTVNHNGRNCVIHAGASRFFGVVTDTAAEHLKMLRENKLVVFAGKMDEFGAELPVKIKNDGCEYVPAQIVSVTDLTSNRKLKFAVEWQDAKQWADKMKTGGFVIVAYWTGVDSNVADGCLGRLVGLRPVSGNAGAMAKEVTVDQKELVKELQEVYRQKHAGQKKQKQPSAMIL